MNNFHFLETYVTNILKTTRYLLIYFLHYSVNIWNLVEILRHVDRPPRSLRSHYPNSYLKLPLLKFEMLTMRAAAPEIYEENS